MNEVVAELDGSGFEDSKDDVDGYLDMDRIAPSTPLCRSACASAYL